MIVRLDLHIHTKASKCFEDENFGGNAFVNKAIIQQAKNRGLNLIAITDHYTLKNYLEVKAIGLKENIEVIPGMEFSIKANTPDKVSLIALFNENIDPLHLEYKILHGLNIPPEAQGNGYFSIENDISKILDVVEKNNGLLISTHQDKNEERQSFIPILIEKGIKLFDLRYPKKRESFLKKFGKYNVIPLTFSDAHKINDVGKYFMELPLSECSFFGFKKYINGII